MRVLNINGGIGRVICSSGSIREGDVVISSSPEMLRGLGAKVYPLQTPYIYEDIVKDNEYIEPEPYNCADYYRDQHHLCQVFNKLINGVDEYVAPRIVLTKNELIEARTFVAERKIILYQPWGSMGGFCLGDKKMENVKEDESYRSLGTEFAKKLYNELSKDYTVFVIKADQQVGFGSQCNTFQQQDVRKIIALIPYVKAVVGCDSFLHHASAALGSPVPTIVLWAGTSEKNLGYSTQTNLRGKECIPSPNRIPHNHDYFVDKNRGVNEFSDETLTKVMEAVNDTSRIAPALRTVDDSSGDNPKPSYGM